MKTLKLMPIPSPKRYPTRLGSCIDLLYQLKGQREALSKLDDLYKEAFTLLHDHLLNTVKKADLEGAKGLLAQVSIARKEIPTIEDFDKLAAYILKTKQLSLLHRSLSTTAVRERWEDKKTVPGVGKFTKVSLSLTKRGS